MGVNKHGLKYLVFDEGIVRYFNNEDSELLENISIKECSVW